MMFQNKTDKRGKESVVLAVCKVFLIPICVFLPLNVDISIENIS